MKNLFYILFAVVFIFSGCEKEEESNNNSNNNNNTSSSIIGSWDCTEYNTIMNSGYYLPDGSKIITNSIDSNFMENSNVILIYRWTFLSNGLINSYTYMNGEDSSDTLTYIKSENLLLIDDIPTTITELSPSKLVFYFEDYEETDTSDGTIYFTDYQYLEMKFDRSTFTLDNISSKKTGTIKDTFFKGFMNNKK